jgi:hypothetical protein
MWTHLRMRNWDSFFKMSWIIFSQIFSFAVGTSTFQCPYYAINCDYYSCSYTSCSFTACYGDTVSLSTCASYSGNTYLSLYYTSALASNDNYCSYGSYLQYEIPYSGCRTYYARQSCSPGYYNSCSGYTTVTITSPPSATPTTFPTFIPSRLPSVRPTFHPTNTPSVQPSPSPTPAPSLQPTPSPSSSPTLRPSHYPTAPTMRPTQLVTADCPSYSTLGSSHPVVCTITTALCPGDNFTASTCATSVGDTLLALKLGGKTIATGDDGCGVVAGGSLLSHVVTGTDCALYTLSQMCYASKQCGATTHYEIVRTNLNLPAPKQSSSTEELSVSTIAGIAVGVTIGICILIGVVGFLAFRLGTTYQKFPDFQDFQEDPAAPNTKGPDPQETHDIEITSVEHEKVEEEENSFEDL